MSVDNDKSSGRLLIGTTAKNVAKVRELSWKTEGEQCTMFVTLSNCSMECVSEFRHLSSTCDALQWNLRSGCWAMTKRNTTLPCSLRLRNSPKTTPTSSPPSLLVMNVGFMDHLSGRCQIHCDPRKHDPFETMSNQCWFVFLLLFFSLTVKESCIRNLFHQERQWMQTYIGMFWSG
jgi:hypothetical protein